jgi:hypothetical protein
MASPVIYVLLRSNTVFGSNQKYTVDEQLLINYRDTRTLLWSAICESPYSISEVSEDISLSFSLKGSDCLAVLAEKTPDWKALLSNFDNGIDHLTNTESSILGFEFYFENISLDEIRVMLNEKDMTKEERSNHLGEKIDRIRVVNLSTPKFEVIENEVVEFEEPGKQEPSANLDGIDDEIAEFEELCQQKIPAKLKAKLIDHEAVEIKIPSMLNAPARQKSLSDDEALSEMQKLLNELYLTNTEPGFKNARSEMIDHLVKCNRETPRGVNYQTRSLKLLYKHPICSDHRDVDSVKSRANSAANSVSNLFGFFGSDWKRSLFETSRQERIAALIENLEKGSSAPALKK